ncbi:hypothetical protein CLOM_g8729 [Closterium sp. NIES-68]|nr:hypothetical protein CLOM_g8729 [Closterium sp. NIES-68]GJP68601.1 hypothetical protein CLOP_g25281 [Closterium sp. NIES-67]
MVQSPVDQKEAKCVGDRAGSQCVAERSGQDTGDFQMRVCLPKEGPFLVSRLTRRHWRRKTSLTVLTASGPSRQRQLEV